MSLFSAIAQEVPITTQQQLENTAEAMEDEAVKDDNYLQDLAYYHKHKIDINAAGAEELQALKFLTDLQIGNIINYRRLVGKFISLYELQAVPTLDVGTIRKLEPFIYAGTGLLDKENFIKKFRSGDQYTLLRMTRQLETSKGYDTSLRTHYLGDPNRLLLRYRYQYKNLLQYGFLADKDAGEEFFKGAQKQGFDFYSAHFFYKNEGVLKTIALGDYMVNMGQGLVQWQSMAFGKSGEVLSVKRQAPVIMPYHSAGEFYFNRGAAVNLQFKQFETVLFGSTRKFSGNYIHDSVDRFSSFQTSGYYRTVLEAADRYNVTDISYGGSLVLKLNNGKLGINSVLHNFSLPIKKRDEPYNYYSFSGKRMINSSFEYAYTVNNIHLFGEAAIDKDQHPALIAGALMAVDPKIDLSLLYRSISKEYQSFFGNAFTENTLPSNETGLYSGIVVRPQYQWQLTAYADFFSFPFMKYRVNGPSRGSDHLLQLTYTPDKKSEFQLRYKAQDKPINGSSSGIIDFPVPAIKKDLRLQYSTEVSNAIAIKVRTEMMWFNKDDQEKQEGFLAYVETKVKPNSKLSSNLRLQYFETGGYDSRIYAYESDVLYSFSIPAFFDKGFRYYANLNYDLNKHVSLWLRCAQTIYNNRETVGSGLDEVQGNKKSEVKVQVIGRF
jgi:hypothetical protein